MIDIVAVVMFVFLFAWIIMDSFSRSAEIQTLLSAVNLNKIEPDVNYATKPVIDQEFSTASGEDLNNQSCLRLMAEEKNVIVLKKERLVNELSLVQSKPTDSHSKLQMFQNVHDELATTKSELENNKRVITDITEKNLRLTNEDSRLRRKMKRINRFLVSSRAELEELRTSLAEQKLDKVHDKLARARRKLESTNRSLIRLEKKNLRLMMRNDKRLRRNRNDDTGNVTNKDPVLGDTELLEIAEETIIPEESEQVEDSEQVEEQPSKAQSKSTNNNLCHNHGDPQVLPQIPEKSDLIKNNDNQPRRIPKDVLPPKPGKSQLLQNRAMDEKPKAPEPLPDCEVGTQTHKDFKIRVLRGVNLPDSDRYYVAMRVQEQRGTIREQDKKVGKSKTIRGSQPEWNKDFTIKTPDPEWCLITIKLKKSSKLGLKASTVGSVVIHASELKVNQVNRLQLYKTSCNPVGKACLEVEIEYPPEVIPRPEIISEPNDTPAEVPPSNNKNDNQPRYVPKDPHELPPNPQKSQLPQDRAMDEKPKAPEPLPDCEEVTQIVQTPKDFKIRVLRGVNLPEAKDSDKNDVAMRVQKRRGTIREQDKKVGKSKMDGKMERSTNRSLVSSRAELEEHRTSLAEQKLNKAHAELALSKRELELRKRAVTRLEKKNLRLMRNDKRLRRKIENTNRLLLSGQAESEHLRTSLALQQLETREFAEAKRELESRKRTISELEEKNLSLVVNDSQLRRKMRDTDRLLVSSNAEVETLRRSVRNEINTIERLLEEVESLNQELAEKEDDHKEMKPKLTAAEVGRGNNEVIHPLRIEKPLPIKIVKDSPIIVTSPAQRITGNKTVVVSTKQPPAALPQFTKSYKETEFYDDKIVITGISNSNCERVLGRGGSFKKPFLIDMIEKQYCVRLSFFNGSLFITGGNFESRVEACNDVINTFPVTMECPTINLERSIFSDSYVLRELAFKHDVKIYGPSRENKNVTIRGEPDKCERVYEILRNGSRSFLSFFFFK
jgi:hypothetical protein